MFPMQSQRLQTTALQPARYITTLAPPFVLAEQLWVMTLFVSVFVEVPRDLEVM
jgi:hypothetical protein